MVLAIHLMSTTISQFLTSELTIKLGCIFIYGQTILVHTNMILLVVCLCVVASVLTSAVMAQS